PQGRTATLQAVGGAAIANGYPVEMWNFTMTDPTTGVVSTRSMTTSFNASAQASAALLSNLPGVSANAFTEAALTDANISNFSAPLQLRLNGQDLIAYELGVIDNEVPNPAVNEGEFYDYLAEQINGNATLRSQGFYAIS